MLEFTKWEVSDSIGFNAWIRVSNDELIGVFVLLGLSLSGCEIFWFVFEHCIFLGGPYC